MLTKRLNVPEYGMYITWVEGGRIVYHDSKTGDPLSMEDYTKSALSRIMRFCENIKSSNSFKSAYFNYPAQELLSDVEALQLEADDEICLGITCSKDKGNRVYAHGPVMKMTILKKDTFFHKKARYIVSYENGLFEFYHLEDITPANLFRQYPDPILSVY